MTYSNINPNVTQDTASFTSMPIFYNTIPLLENIPHDSQVVVERIFSTELAGSVNTLAEFLASPSVSPFHKRQIFKIPNNRMVFNEITKTITSVNLPSSGAGVYIYVASGFSVSVPPLTVGQKITVERKTVSNVPLITWVPGSKLTTLQLNRAATQNLFLTQEILSLIDRKIAYDGNSTVEIPDDSITSLKIVAGAIFPYHLTATTVDWSLFGNLKISSLTPSLALFSDANKNIVTRSITGSGSVVLQDSPVLTSPSLGTPTTLVGTNITGTATNFTSTTCTTIPSLSGNVTSSGNVVTLNATQSGITGLGTLLSLTVSGASSLTSLTVSGSSSLSTLGVSGTSTLGVINATGNASIAGNLNITGNISWSGNASGTSATSQQVADPTIYLAASPCAFTGSIAGTVLNVTVMGSNQFLSIGSIIVGAGVTIGTRVTAYGTGTGTTGLYTITPSQTVSSTSMTGTGSSSALSNGGGIALMASGAGGNKTITCDTTAGTWDFNQNIRLSAGNGLYLTGGTSGTVSILPQSAAGTSSVLQLPVSANDTLIGRATTDTLTNKTWNSNVITGQYGGTGVANTSKTITLGGNLITSGNFATTLTVSGTTGVTLPLTGTLATLDGAETLTNKTFTSPVLGTPTSGNLSNCTGFPVANVSGLGTGVAAFLATPTSANLATAVTGEQGTGALVFNNAPTLIAPVLGTPASGNLSLCTNYPISALTGTLGVGNGGTGLTTTTANSVLITGVNSITPLAIGTPNQVLRVNSGATGIEWGGSGGGVLATSGGGTGKTNTAWTPGCIVIGSVTTGELTTLDNDMVNGSYDGAILTADSSQPNGVKWAQSPGTGGGTGGTTFETSGNQIIDSSAANSGSVANFSTTLIRQNTVVFTATITAGIIKQVNCRQFDLGRVNEYIVYMPSASGATLVQFNLSTFSSSMAIQLELRSKAGHAITVPYSVNNTTMQVTGIVASGATTAFPSPYNVVTGYKVFGIRVTQNLVPNNGTQRIITVENLFV